MNQNKDQRPGSLDDVKPSKSDVFWFNLFWAAWGIGVALYALLYLFILFSCPKNS